MARELTYGLDGDDVLALQTVLLDMGYTEVGTPDSKFGDHTVAAVTRFQNEHSLTPSGVVDDVTRATVVATALSQGMLQPGSPLIQDADSLAQGTAPQHSAATHESAAPASHDAAGAIPADAPRSDDGNYWWDGTSWQLIHHTEGHAQAEPAAAKADDYVDLLQGFIDLAVAAVHDGGRKLDTVHFGGHLSSAHHTLLLHVQGTLIDAQADSAAREKAVQDWPALESKLRAAAGEAQQAGVAPDSVLTFTEYVAAIGEQYVHAKHKGAAHTESGEDYADLITGIREILETVNKVWWDWTAAVFPTNLDDTNAQQQADLHALQFGSHLTPAHHELLDGLRKAFLLARTRGSARAALAQWQSVQPALHHALTQAPDYVTTDLSWTTKMIGDMDEQLFHQGVIAEAEHAAESHAGLATPDLPLQIKRLQEAAEGYSEVEQLIEKSQELTSESALAAFLAKGHVQPELAHTIFEIAKNPGEIYEKYKEFQEKGVIDKAITVGEMADKVLAVRNGVAKVAFETIKSFAEKRGKEMAAQGLAELAENWKGTAEWAEQQLKVLEGVEKAALVIQIVVGAIKVIDCIAKGDWKGAIEEAASTGFSIAVGAAAGTAGTVMLAGVAVLVAAEIEGISGAAAMIRYARESNEREAALDFIAVCETASSIEAQSLVAEVEVLKDPANAGEKPRIEAKLDDNAKYWRSHLHELSELYFNDAENAIGGQPALKAALGADAQRVLSAPDEGSDLTGEKSWELMAHQIQVVFAGANAMTQHFVDKKAKE